MKAPNKFLIPVEDFVAAQEKIDVLSDEVVAEYLEALANDPVVLEALKTSFDRDVAMRPPQSEQIKLARIASGHIHQFINSRKLPKKGFGQLQVRQGKWARKTFKQ